ncbi:MAG: DUF4034 domain-containing protein [Rhodospirillales bacterium]|nr:DUF4034 domain-containing protein [Rhodospirillales bacterium]
MLQPLTLRRLGLLLVSILLAALTSACLSKTESDTVEWAAYARHKEIDKLELLELLRERQFAELDTRLEGYQNEFETGNGQDVLVRYALSTFKSTDPQVGALLDEWVDSVPSSYVAALARTVRYMNLGWLSRGQEFVRLTPDQSLRDMERYFALAETEADRALELNSKLSVAYGLLIEMAKSGRTRFRARHYLRQALQAAPNSIQVRIEYLFSLVPWWGGSLEEIRAFIEESKADLPPEIGLGPLEGFEFYVQGQILAREGRPREAIRYYDRALEYGEFVGFLTARGNARKRGQLADRALPDFDRALEIIPNWPGGLSARAGVLSSMGEHDRAEADWTLALKLDPLNTKILHARALWLKRQRRYVEALAVLRQAEVYGALNFRIHFDRGYINLYFIRDTKAAREDFLKAIELAPHVPDARFYYAEALFDRQIWLHPSCDALKAYETYWTVCQRNEKCSERYVHIAKYLMDEHRGTMAQC